MHSSKKQYNTILTHAKKGVPGFERAYTRFIERTIINQSSKSLILNYGRSLAYVALEFNRIPHEISVEELNCYLYRKMVHDQCSLTYFKHTVYALRYWFRLYNMEEKAIQLPPIKKVNKLPEVLSKSECIELFKAPRSLKHRFILTMAYGSGLRMNELRHLRITDLDINRMQVHIRQGKGRKDRYVPLSVFIAQKLSLYLEKYKPQTWLFEGNTPGYPMGERTIQYVINEAIPKTTIKKRISMHTLRHSFATHLLEDGIDIHSIQHLLGHAQLLNTLVYLHVAKVKSKPVHSPLDTLYNMI